ncbi:MAG: hypothetical protein KJP07_05940, partial [Desulfatitalea sp.]|nr:hypothetical protein [Desulfatitalea sp.]
GLFLPLIKTPADIEGLSYLSEDEKALGLHNLEHHVALTDGWEMLGNDPELQMFIHLYGNELLGLLPLDMQVIPFSPLNLISLEVARRVGNDYVFGLMKGSTIAELEPFGYPEIAQLKFHFLAFPNLKIWNEEERLTLKFVKACYENKLTRELFEQAREAWGEKRLLRHIGWMGYMQTWSL